MSDLIRITNLSDVNVADALATKSILNGIWSSYDNNVDLKTGALDSLVSQPAALLMQVIDDTLSTWQTSTNLSTLLSTDDKNINSSFLDRIAANFKIDRKAGTYSTGTLEIIVSSNSRLTIPANSTFTCNNITFYASALYSVYSSNSDVVFDTDQTFTQVGTGKYAFYIPLTSATASSAANVEVNSTFTPNITIANFVSARAYSSFSGGAVEETNEELADRIISGISAPVLSSRTNMGAALAATSYGTYVINDSIIGAGDIEMQRDRHPIFPISVGGKADWYIQTANSVLIKPFTLPATYSISTNLWTVDVGRDVCPGFYDVDSATVQIGSTQYALSLTSDVRGYDVSDIDAEITPTIINPLHSLYSRYQTATLKFKYTSGGDTSISSGDVIVKLKYQPHIANLQSFVSSVNNQMFAGDVLVKAPIPIYVSIAANIVLTDTSATISEETIKNAICLSINTRGFSDTLPKSVITKAIQDNIPSKAYLSSVMMSGSLSIPAYGNVDKHSSVKSGDDTLYLEYAPTATDKNMCFFCSPSNIYFNVIDD